MSEGSAARGFSQRFADFIIQTRWFWLAAGLIVTAAIGFGASKLWINPDARQFFAEENPDRQALDAFEAEFAKDDNLVVMISPEDGAVFTPDTLSMIGEFTERAWLLPYVRRVNSITNFQHSYAIDDEMIVGDLVADPLAITDEDAAVARAIALSRTEIVNSLLDPEASHTAIQVLFRIPGIDAQNEVPEIVAEAQALIAEFRGTYPNHEFRSSGAVMINNQFNVSGQSDMKNLTLPMFGIILLVVLLTLQSFVGVVMTLLVIAMSAIIGLGALGWSGNPLNSVTILSPLIIMTLAVASVIHVLSSVRQTMVDTSDRLEWARRALAEHAGEIAIACLTTAIGFLALNFSISPPFRELGNIVAAGVLGTLFLSLTFLPALITLLPMGRKTRSASTDRLMRPIAEFVIAWRKPVLVVMTLIVVALASGIPRLALEDDFIRYFDESYEFRRDSDYYEKNLGGLSLLEFALDSGRSDGINDPDFLGKVDAFANWMRAQPEVRHVNSLTSTIKRLNMNMHADDPAMNRIPDDDRSAAQFLFLYELSLGYGMDLTDQVNIDRSKMRVSVALAGATTSEMRELTTRSNAWFDANAPDLKSSPTGIVQVFNLISYRDVRAMISGTTLALVAISILLLFILRDIRLGLISLIPNLIPAAMAFGVWGYTVGAVTLAIAVVIAMTLGIVVDDTVHFLSKYKEGRRRGKSAEDSVRHAFDKVGMALCVTTLALVSGFALLAQSGFAVNGDMAKLTALTITLALIADFLLLPALLITIDKGRTEMTSIPAARTAAAILAIGVAGFAASESFAQSAEEKGLAIAMAADQSDKGWGDFTSDGEMILRDSNGNENRRVWRGMTLERTGEGDGDWSIIVFSAPRDIDGTANLTHSKVEPQDDDQWLFLPAVKRVKRISSSNRTGKFVGSEFSFEDLGSQEVADNTYKWLRDEPCPQDAALTCHVVENAPKNKRSGYSKRIAWIDSDEYRQHQVEFYNRRGDLEKILTSTGFEEFLGEYWRPASLSMANKQTGKSTELRFSNYQFGTGLTEGDFNAQRLPRLSR